MVFHKKGTSLNDLRMTFQHVHNVYIYIQYNGAVHYLPKFENPHFSLEIVLEILKSLVLLFSIPPV